MKKIVTKLINIKYINLVSILFLFCVVYIINRNSTNVLNDDLVLELCYSGYFSGGIPVSDHLYQHFFLTQIFSYLYTHLYFINWYFYLHLLFLVLSFFTILNILKNNVNKYYILILVLFLFFIEYIYFTYTRISFFVSFSGFLFYLKYERLDRYKFIFSSLMILIGSIIRPESGILALIVFILLFLCSDKFKNKISEKYFRNQLIFVLILPFVIFVTHKFSNIENSRRFPLAVINITESKLYKPSSFKDQMLDSYDIQRLKNFYFDERFVSKYVVNYAKSRVVKKHYKTQFFYSTDSLIYIFLNQRIYLFLFVILFLQILLIKGYVNKLKFSSIIVCLILLLLFFNVFFELPIFKDRVMEPLFFSLIISYYIKDTIFESKFNKFIGLLILLLFSYVLIVPVLKDEYVMQDESIKTELNKVYNRLPKGEMIFDPIFFSLKSVFPGNCKVGETENFKEHQLLPIGWAQRSYSRRVLYSKMGVEKMDDLLIKSNTTLIVDSSQLILWNNYGEKYLNRNLVPYDSVCINDNQNCYFLSRYKRSLKSKE